MLIYQNVSPYFSPAQKLLGAPPQRLQSGLAFARPAHNTVHQFQFTPARVPYDAMRLYVHLP